MGNNMLLTTESISWKSLLMETEQNVPNEIKVHLMPMIEYFSKYSEKNKNDSNGFIKNMELRLETCLDRIWETLHSGHWKDVPIQYRYSYSICSVLKAICLEHQNNIETDLPIVLTMIKQIDKGILLGAPLQSSPELLTTIASQLNGHFIKISSKTELSNRIDIKDIDMCSPPFPEFRSVPSYEQPSMESFYRDIFQPKVPAIVKGCMKHWKSLEKWKDIEYLKRVAGTRTVPIEVGSKYTEDDWAQQLITFSEYLETYISSTPTKIGYLAQHQLFQQIPELKDDFSIPDFCSFSDTEEENSTDTNAWFGPAGTVSPLHYDPKNNLLCQVFGYKRIVLYKPEDSEYLYPYETRLLCNTAQVDPYKPDYEKWPKFKSAEAFFCYLKPGEMLFIPPKWWHHVVSLSPSFSISFWWN